MIQGLHSTVYFRTNIQVKGKVDCHKLYSLFIYSINIGT